MTAMRNVIRTTTLILSVAAITAMTAVPALGHDHRVTDRETVFPGLVHEDFSVRLSDASVARGNIVRFQQHDDLLELRPVLARDRIAGLESTPSMAVRERPNNALAGTNGGYWLPRPHGAPNGFAVQDGTLIGGQSQTRNGHPRARGAVGVRTSGALLLDRLNVNVDLRYADGTACRGCIDEVNLQPRLEGTSNVPDGELIIYDEDFGTGIDVPANSVVIVVEGVRLTPMGWVSGTVRSAEVASSDTTYAVPSGTSVLMAHGDARIHVAEITPGQTISARARPQALNTDHAAWGSSTSSVPGGPLLIVDGRRTSFTEWESEAFSGSHLTGRHPRTAIGLTAAGEVLMVTIDGRREGHSVGMTMRELQLFLEGLGARHALNLDGGGSTTMTVEGTVRNRPSETGRSVANALFVYHSYPFDGTHRISGSDRYATAGAVSRRSHPDGADEVVIATGSTFPDALAGGPLAVHLDAPLLLTASDHLPRTTLDALDRLRPRSALLLGGTTAISDDVRRQLEGRDISVRRVHGPDRYATATAVAERLVGSADVERVFLATGAGFADALSAATPAGMFGAPILLTRADRLPEETERFIREREVREVVIVGGRSVVARSIESDLGEIDPDMGIRRLGGDNRYGTARAVNEWASPRVPTHDGTGLFVANGNNFPDALAGGPLAAQRDHLLMIVPPEDALGDSDAKAYLDARGDGPLERITLLGGRIALTSYQQWQLDQIAIR